MQLKTGAKKFLHKKLVKRYEKQLHKQTISYEKYIAKLEWNFVREMEAIEGFDETKVQMICYPELEGTFGLSDVNAEYIAFYPMDGIPSEFVKKAIWYYFTKNLWCDFVYGDEDSIDKKGVRYNPYWKPDWSPTEYESVFYIYGVFAIRKSALREEDFLRSDSWLKNIMHLCDNVTKRCNGFEKRCDNNLKIGHLPQILFHRSNHTKRAPFAKVESLWCEKTENPLVSVVVLSKDNYPLLRSNIETIWANEPTSFYEIIVVDNGSEEENRELVDAFCKKHGIRYIYEKTDFNFSYLCNIGAKEAKGKYLLFMNDDVEAASENFMCKMLMEAQKSYVGAVGCKLLYPGTTKIQHAGIVNLPIGPIHKLQFEKDKDSLYFGRNKKNINCIAVTAACLMVDAKKFEEVGGFPNELAIAYNDVALGFALQKAGYYNVCLNDMALYHHESLTRGADSSKEKMRRLNLEQKKLYALYPDYVGYDPYYSVRLAKDIANTRMEMKLVSNEEEWVENTQVTILKKKSDLVENMAVIESIEWILEGNNGIMFSGWAFVNGLDNATFQKELWLIPEDETKTTYKVKLNRRLRQDVASNVEGQKHVELSGYCVNINKTELEKGEYTICVVLKERFSKLKLMKKTNRSILIE